MQNFFVIGCLAVILAGCGDDPTGGGVAPSDDGDGLPDGVRFLHIHQAQPGPLDLLVRNRETEEEIRIGGVDLYEASDWMPVPSGIHTLLFFRAGTPDVLPDLSVENIDIQEGRAKTIIAGQTSAGEARTTQLIDDITATNAPSENHGRLRFLHMAEAAAIDLYNDADGSRLVTNIQNGAFEDYQELPSTRYDITAYSEGLRDEVLATTTEFPLPPANVSTLVLVGDTDPNDDGDTSDSAAILLHIDDYTY